MFELSEIITRFNQTHREKIKLNKNWGLSYLQPEGLALLNKNAQLIRDSVYYEPPFTISRKGEHKTSAETKSQPVQNGVSAVRDSIRKININQIVSYRLSWEGRFLAALNNDQIWVDFEEKINQKDKSIKQYFRQVRQNWNIHKPFQYHSSKGLLFLLDIIVKYQDHFSEAYKELQRKKQTWIPFSRIPHFIAEEYESFLKKELKKFELLRKQVLDALFLRLKTAEKQGLVTCDDVSYTLALQSESLRLIKCTLPEYRTVLDTNTFNHMQRAIEKHGDESHISQLYQLAWYQCNSNEFTTITMSGSRFLTPSALVTFMSKKKKKWFWFSSGNKIALQFLEKQQALLAQLFLQPVCDRIILKPIYKGYPELLTLSTQYQLLQQSRCLLNQQHLYWWQWEKKFWKKTWQGWLGQQLDKKQVSLLNKLNETFEEVKKYNHKLQNVKFHEQVQVILKAIRTLMNEDVSKCENASLINMFKYVHENSQVKADDSVDPTQRAPKVLPQMSPQPVRVKDMQEGKSTGLLGLLPTKFLAGNKASVSTEKKPEIKIDTPKMR